MGKKSRRNRNKKTGNDAASATATATATIQCFHGSTADTFHLNGEYMKAAQEYVDMRDQATLLYNQDGNKDQQVLAIRRIYDEDHMHLIEDPEFHRFIFAYCTKLYLESNNLKDQSRWPAIKVLLHLGLRYRYTTNPNDRLNKYFRDILFEGGMIKVLVRETKTHCACMNEGKVIAKAMGKIGICHGCDEEFPKEDLYSCDGCQVLRYHNRECQINHWHIHKSDCKRSSKSIAKVRNDSNDRNIRVAMAASLGWCLNAAGVHSAFQSSLSNDPLEAAKQLPAVDWVQFVLGCGAIEWMAYWVDDSGGG